MSEQEVEAVLPPSETLGGPAHIREVVIIFSLISFKLSLRNEAQGGIGRGC